MTPDDALREGTAAPPAAAQALPFHAYRDPDLFDLEMERIFRGDWVAVCAERLLAEPGSHVALAIGGEPVVVLRGQDGELRALSNVCRHRGTPILDDGFGTEGSLVCPYHAWAYADDGRFRGAPHTGNVEIDAEAHALPRFALEVWQGVVFVNVDGQAAPLRERMAPLEATLLPFGLDGFEVPYGFTTEIWDANWKLAYENGIESYHLFRIHPETFEALSPTRHAYYIAGGALTSLTGGAPTEGTEASASADPIERGDYVLVAVPPSFVALVTRELFAWIAIHPESPSGSRIVSGSVVPRWAADGSAGTTDMDPLTRRVLDEDRWICERGQRGMASRHSRGGQLVELERIVGDFHQYLGLRLFGQEPAPFHVEPRPA